MRDRRGPEGPSGYSPLRIAAQLRAGAYSGGSSVLSAPLPLTVWSYARRPVRAERHCRDLSFNMGIWCAFDIRSLAPVNRSMRPAHGQRRVRQSADDPGPLGK